MSPLASKERIRKEKVEKDAFSYHIPVDGIMNSFSLFALVKGISKSCELDRSVGEN